MSSTIFVKSRSIRHKDTSAKSRAVVSSNNDIKYQVNQVKKDRGHAPTRSRFVPPSVDEVRAYCEEQGYNVDPQRFVDFYTVSGWTRGKTKIKDWRACVRTWVQRDKQTGRKSAGHDYLAYQEESL